MFNETEKYYLYLNLTNIFNLAINKYEDPNKLQELKNIIKINI